MIEGRSVETKRQLIRLARSRLWWAQTQGVEQAFLQVMENNAAARGLQVRLGFVEVYRYWYRLQS